MLYKYLEINDNYGITFKVKQYPQLKMIISFKIHSF